MLNFIIFSATAWLWTLIMGIAGLPLLLLSTLLKKHLPLWFPHFWAKGILLCYQISGQKITYKGKNNIPTGAAIIASQHQSVLETLVYGVLLDCPAYVLKKELHDIPILGWYLAQSNMIAIDRSSRVKALNSVMHQASIILSQNRKLVIFPEGTRVAINDKRPYNRSIYRLYQLGYPVIPAALNTGGIWRKGATKFTAKEAVFSFLPPMKQGLSQDDFMAHLRKNIESEATKL